MRALARPLLLVLLCLALWGCAAPPARPSAVQGVLDLRRAAPTESQPVDLEGQWQVWWGLLVDPDQLAAAGEPTLMHVPGAWEGAPVVPGGAPAEGFATMRLRVLLPPSEEKLAIFSDAMGVAHRLWVNGELVQAQGVVGRDRASEVPDVRPLARVLDAPGEDMELVLQISNFHHRVGGQRRAILLGPADAIVRRVEGSLIRDMVGITTLAVSGLYFLVIFRMRTRNKATLYFALFCLVLALRSSSSGGSQALRILLPDLSWSAMMRVEYMATNLALGLGAMMLGVMFPKDVTWRLVRATVGISALLVAIAAVSPMPVYTRALPIFQVSAVVALAVITTDLVRAARNRRPLALFSLAGMVLFCVGVAHDMLYTNHMISSVGEISSLTLVLFLFGQGWGHAREFSRSYDTIERLSENLLATNADLEQTNRAVERFVPYAFLDLLHKASIKDVQRGDHAGQDMGILFCDLRGFTTLVEGLSPEAAFEFINRYLRVMEPAIHEHAGFINQYLGDCIMALFPGEVDAAFAGALRMLDALRAWNVERLARGEAEVLVGVGLSAGPLMLGTIGGMDRLDNGVIGDAVNRAARLEGLTKRYGTVMIADEHVVGRLKRPEAVALRALDRVVLKGRSEPVRLYEVLGALPPATVALRLRGGAAFARGVEAWERGRFDAAKAAFTEVLSLDPSDGPAMRLLRQCAERAGTSAEGWQGVTVLAEK